MALPLIPMAYDTTTNPFVVADAAPADRARFYRRTYAHVAGAFVAWGALLALFFADAHRGSHHRCSSDHGYLRHSLPVMLGIMFATTAAQTMAFNRSSKATQYAGLGLAVLAEAVLFVPLVVLVVLQTSGTRSFDAQTLRGKRSAWSLRRHC